jgi:hypothetical protein
MELGRLDLFVATIVDFVWKDWQNHDKTERIIGALSEICKGHTPNINQELYSVALAFKIVWLLQLSYVNNCDISYCNICYLQCQYFNIQSVLWAIAVYTRCRNLRINVVSLISHSLCNKSLLFLKVISYIV